MIYTRLKHGFFFFFTLLIGCKDADMGVHPMVQNIKEWVFATGHLEWANEYSLTAQTDGILLNADYEIGDTVHEGSLFAVIDNPSSLVNTEVAREQLDIALENINPQSPALQQIEESIRFADEKYKQDKSLFEKYERLLKSESISNLEYENARIAVENSLSTLNSLKKQYQVLQQQAQSQKVTASGQHRTSEIIKNYNQIKVIQSGTIIKKLKNTGDFVRRGEVVAIVADPSKIEINLAVDEKSIGKIRVGQETKIRLNTDKNTVFTGKVSSILSAFDETSQSFICRINLLDSLPSGLNIHGTALEGNILVAEKNNALIIPRDYMGYGNKVTIKGRDTATIIYPGIISSDFVEVLEGVTENDILLPLKP